ncbi:MAG: DUF1549 domain-containing protein [Planctomycetia bacterium]|nr:DUF1549 domain-containing protein [Planctomycetia bacterium]
MLRSLPRVALAAVLAAAATGLAADPGEPLSFNGDIRPILVENCFSCHGADSAGRKADLRLDQRDQAVESGSIVPGDPDSSVMLDRIFSDDPEEVMPPPETKKSLSAGQKAALTRWIKEGAEYEPHWSFIPPTKPAPPTVKNEAWAKNPIDRFILARLEAKGLAPAPEADRRTLARRAAFDVTGLPPDPAAVERFVADARPDAYERYLDALFASPEWGEHRGRHWLDYARYADTHGIHFDNEREIWTFRQWVIEAFNKNLPFDRFTELQLAGDLVDLGPDAPTEAVLEARIGSGFHRCNMTTNEGGIIDEEYVVLYARDRTETTATVWMGLTVGCAVCHDHKFDPISMKDFYSLSAFFNNTTQAPRDGNVKGTPPILFVPLLRGLPRQGHARLGRRRPARRHAARLAPAGRGRRLEDPRQPARQADGSAAVPQGQLAGRARRRTGPHARRQGRRNRLGRRLRARPAIHDQLLDPAAGQRFGLRDRGPDGRQGGVSRLGRLRAEPSRDHAHGACLARRRLQGRGRGAAAGRRLDAGHARLRRQRQGRGREDLLRRQGPEDRFREQQVQAELDQELRAAHDRQPHARQHRPRRRARGVRDPRSRALGGRGGGRVPRRLARRAREAAAGRAGPGRGRALRPVARLPGRGLRRRHQGRDRGRGGDRRDPRPGHDRPRDGREAPAADGPHPRPRRIRQAEGAGDGRHARGLAGVPRQPAPQPPGPRQVAARGRASAHGPCHGQPLLAGGLRHGPRQDGR